MEEVFPVIDIDFRKRELGGNINAS